MYPQYFDEESKVSALFSSPFRNAKGGGREGVFFAKGTRSCVAAMGCDRN